MTERRLRDDALAIWKAGVDAVHAGRLVTEALPRHTEAIRAARRVAVVGAGKATTVMAEAAEAALGERIAAGWVNVPDATVVPLRRIHVHGARKLPDNRPTAEGVAGSKRILEIAQSLDADDLLVVLISGGGSALLPLPVEGVTLEEKLAVTKLLQEAGATIDDMNCVRKHLSQIKGGRLARATKARVLTLIVSDVIGDPLDVIASGPTAPDPSTFRRACTILETRGLSGAVPGSVRTHLEAGRDGHVEETPKSGLGRVENLVIGNSATARGAAVAAARGLGWETVDIGDVDGDTAQTAHRLSVLPEAAKRGGLARACVISGGETTVDLRVVRRGPADPVGPGKGGRNQEFALATLAARTAGGFPGLCVLCGGTDGEDGPTDAGGAFVDETIARSAVEKGLDPRKFLRFHDAYRFFEQVGGLVKTGPTSTNVMDLRVVLFDDRARSLPEVRLPWDRLRARAEPG